MSAKNYPPLTLASAVFGISIATIVAWILAAFAFVILRHP